MRSSINWKVLTAAALAIVLFAAVVAAANKYNKPKSVIHVVTLYWKPGTTPEQIQTALNGVEKMAGQIPGMKNIWLRSFKVQGQIGQNAVTHAFVMEFEDENALKVYADHPAHKEWEKIYVPLRGESRSFDITN